MLWTASSYLLVLSVVCSAVSVTRRAPQEGYGEDEEEEKQHEPIEEDNASGNVTYTIGRRVQCMWNDTLKTWYVAYGTLWRRLRYKHVQNNFTDNNRRAFYVNDDEDKWWRLEYPTSDLMFYIKRLPDYKGNRHLVVTAADIQGDVNVPVVQEEHVESDGKYMHDDEPPVTLNPWTTVLYELTRPPFIYKSKEFGFHTLNQSSGPDQTRHW